MKNRLDQLDKTKWKAGKVADTTPPGKIPKKDRLAAAYILSLRAYGLDPAVPHRLDKTILIRRRRPIPPGYSGKI